MELIERLMKKHLSQDWQGLVLGEQEVNLRFLVDAKMGSGPVVLAGVEQGHCEKNGVMEFVPPPKQRWPPLVTDGDKGILKCLLANSTKMWNEL